MKKELEIDPVDGLIIDDGSYSFYEYKIEVKNVRDFIIKYLNPLYKLWRKTKGNFSILFNNIESTIQRIIRKSSCSDRDLWNIDLAMAPRILKYLTAYKNSLEEDRSDYPELCTNWYPEMNITIEEYNMKKSNGEIERDGIDISIENIGEMIFAFEFNINYHSKDREKNNFYNKWNLLNPYRETEDNLSWLYCFREIGKEQGVFKINTFEKIEEFKKEGWIPVCKVRVYRDEELLLSYQKRVSKGMELFGKYFWSLHY